MSLDTPTLVTVSVAETLVSTGDEGALVVVPNESVEILESPNEAVEIVEAAIQGPPGGQGIQGIPGPSGAGVLEIPFAFGDATPKNLVVATANKQVYNVAIHIHTAFNGTGAALSIGDSGDPSRLMGTAQNDPTVAGSYEAAPNHRYGTNTQLLLTITPGGGASQGAGIVTLQIQQ